MKVASSCNAVDARVKLCFFVNVRNASGRNVAGGKRMGSIVALEGGAIENGLRVCAGVPKAGEDDGIGFKVEGVGALEGNIEATLGSLLFCIFVGLFFFVVRRCM